ncbi:FGGY-family carbohydrate kinase [Tsukamurella soli]|uniref:Carbohydrate kinase FGGY N-terminal domain-containing protein n=1 Tax=Tsukamurella soli TaxID=644556 RepID=A0ABP8J4Z8_9ACTN
MSTGRDGRAPVVCGVDIGSTNTKVVAVDPAGLVVARARRATPRQAAHPTVDARRLFDAIEDMIVEVCADVYAVHAVCVAGVGEDGMLVDEELAPLTPALAWFDPRRADVFAELAPRLADHTGLCTDDDPARTLVGWRWAMDQPGAARARAWLSLTDYAPAAWTGRAFLSDTLAARTAAWDGRDRSWIDARVRLGLGRVDLLPPVVHAGAILGELRSGRLESAGVLAGHVAVVAGGHDHPIGGWGVDLVSPGAVLDSMGTAEVVVAQAPRPGIAHRRDLDVAPGIRSTGTTVLSVQELARNVEWATASSPELATHLRALIAGDLDPDVHIYEAAFIPGERGGAAPRFTADAPTSPLSRASAVLGGLARIGLAAQRTVAACLPGNPAIYAAGGWSRSPGWVQAKREVTGAEVIVVPEPQVTGTAAALLAATAVDWAPDPGLAMGLEARASA